MPEYEQLFQLREGKVTPIDEVVSIDILQPCSFNNTSTNNASVTDLLVNNTVVTGQTYRGNSVREAAFVKELSSGNNVSLFSIPCLPGSVVCGTMDYGIHVEDAAGELQAHAGSITFVAVNKGGVITTDIDESYLPASNSTVKTTGTLTDAWYCVAANNATTVEIQAKVTTSLTPTMFHIHGMISLHRVNGEINLM